ncbi:MAG: hypothetical protein IJS14_09945 [Lentisphaeria bacterium]|nr:hypothetical protein [Lentisphaeria bacterium]
MKTLLSLLAVLAASALPAEVTLLERFDTDKVAGKLGPGAVLVADAGLEKGALTATGNGNPFQYFYTYAFPVKPGEKYSFGLDYRTPVKFPGTRLMAVIVYHAPKGAKVPASQLFRLSASGGFWTHRLFDFTVPEGASGAELRLRLVKCGPQDRVAVDFLRLAPQGKLDLTEFETAFDQWSFDRHLIFDRFMMRPGARIVGEWKEAKVGEAFFQADGNQTPMQYPLYIEDITVVPGQNYVFETWAKCTDSFRYPAKGMLIFFFTDANGKAVGQTRLHLRDTKGEWKEFSHSFTTPANAVRMSIGLNFRKISPQEYVRLDHLRFRIGKSKVEVRVDIDPDRETLSLGNFITADIPAESIASMEYRITGPSGRNVAGKYGENTVLPLKDFADGSYQAELCLKMKDGKESKSEPAAFMVCRNPVWRNRLGILEPSDPAPRPWKDLQRKDNSVSSWNNRFQFTPELGLAGIEDGQRMPVLKSLELTVNGKPLGSSPVRWTDGKSMIRGESVCAGANWRGTLTVSADYAGFLRYTLKIRAEKPVVLNSIRLEMNTPEAEFVYRSDDSWTKIGAVDLKKEKSWTTKHFYNEIQFGKMDRGIAFFVPKLYPAVSELPAEWIRVESAGKLTADLVTAPRQLAAGETHIAEFALQPYPFRPAENLWKTLRFRAGKYKNLELIWHTSGHFRYCGSTSEAAKPEVIAEILKRRKGKMLYYQFPFYIMDNIPEWTYFEKRWKGTPARAYDLRKKGGMAWKARLTDRDWQDYYLHQFAGHLQKFSWDGVYYDCFGTDIFTENGETFHPVFACRKFQERIYLTQRMTNPDSLTVTHTGGSQSGTAATYADVILMGEQYRGVCSRYRYLLEHFTLDRFRYENAVNVGPDRMFLPQYHDAGKINDPTVASSIMGLVMVHNLMLYPNFIRKDIELAVRGRMFDFGMETSTFHPYWKTQKNLPCPDSSVVVSSSWTNEKGILTALLNPSGKAQRFKLRIPSGWQVKYYYDPAESRELTAESFELKPYCSALVRLERE